MDHKELLKRVDHTLLTPTAAWDQIQKLCDEGLTFGTASICIPPRYVSRAAGYAPEDLHGGGLPKRLQHPRGQGL